jgi:hypothetical protein
MNNLSTRGALAALACGLAAAAAGPGGRHDEAWVRTRVRTVADSDTTGWQRIPWAASLVDARRAAAREDRFIFLFSHDGNLETGRC